MTILRIHIIALAALGNGLSGGDRIFIEFARRWSKQVPIKLYVWEEGLRMCQREKLAGKFLKINLVKVGILSKLRFIFTYFYRIFLGMRLGLTLKVEEGEYVYSASEFWMDSLPAFILKLRDSKIKWVAAWFQTAPNPLKGFAEGKRENLYRLRAFLYWFIQQPVKPLISKFADFILVNNDTEKSQFPRLAKNNKVIVVYGAVDTKAIANYLKVHKTPKSKKYLAVFQGRFHPQKGVVELMNIWGLVVSHIPNAKLAMIGNGPLMSEVKEKIKNLNLKGNVKLFGYLSDGDKKYSIFNNSKVVVHPAFYDSGGMASAEAMAFGLPCIGFDLKSYQSYYPKGIIRIAIGDHQAFSKAIMKLVTDKKQYETMRREAKKTIEEKWSWDLRADEVLSSISYNI